jgi:hypothetical protein
MTRLRALACLATFCYFFACLLQPWHFVVLSGASKGAFEELTIQLCQHRLPPEKVDATVTKLRRKQAKDWPKVRGLQRSTSWVAELQQPAALRS